jgi:hypothetical protein
MRAMALQQAFKGPLRFRPCRDRVLAAAGAADRPQQGDRLVESRPPGSAVHLQARNTVYEFVNCDLFWPMVHCGIPLGVSGLHAVEVLHERNAGGRGWTCVALLVPSAVRLERSAGDCADASLRASRPFALHRCGRGNRA